jgi:hypothetical protein
MGGPSHLQKTPHFLHVPHLEALPYTYSRLISCTPPKDSLGRVHKDLILHT